VSVEAAAMDGKFFLGMGAILSAGAWFSGALGGGDYERVVGAVPADVRLALQDLDIRQAPGEPGTDPFRSGGIAPLFELTEQGNDMVWTVRSGAAVAVRMIAHLDPVDGGTRTRVTTSVERGDAPDDLIAPAFRSVPVTSGLFQMVIEDQLDDLTRPPGPGAEECRDLTEKLLWASAPAPDRQVGLGGVARTAMTLSAVQGKLKAAGCPTGFSNEWQPVSDTMGRGASGGRSSDSPPRPPAGISFQPGQPMVNPVPR
jgi:hypothetical protein